MSAELMHLMTIEMGFACGVPSVTGTPNSIGCASSNRAEVTCAACLLTDGDKLRALVWDMLSTMGPSREALSFAIRAGQLGVRDPDGRPLVPACLPADPVGASAFRSHAPGCGCPLCEGAIADAADEARRDALELAREDGDYDNCEPTL